MIASLMQEKINRDAGYRSKPDRKYDRSDLISKLKWKYDGECEYDFKVEEDLAHRSGLHSYELYG